MTKNKLIWLIIILAVIIGGIGYFMTRPDGEVSDLPGTPDSPDSLAGGTVLTGEFDPMNASYVIEGETIFLVEGQAETQTDPGVVTKITTRYFGNEDRGDLDGDGRADLAFLLTQDGGGSGVFYYAVVVLNKADGYKTTNTVFIGDRIAPQSTEINESARELNINYAERAPGEPMTAEPTVGAVRPLKVTADDRLVSLMDK